MNCQSSPSDAGSSKSYSGCATGRTRVCVAAFQNQPPMWLSTASVISRSRPTFCTSTLCGTLPLRKPGIFTRSARSEAACSIAWCTSCDGTCTVIRTRFSGSSSTWACTRPFKQTPCNRGRVASARAPLRAHPPRAFDAQPGGSRERRSERFGTAHARGPRRRPSSSGTSCPPSRSTSACTPASAARSRPRSSRSRGETSLESSEPLLDDIDVGELEGATIERVPGVEARARGATSRSPAARASTTRRFATPRRSARCSRAPSRRCSSSATRSRCATR